MTMSGLIKHNKQFHFEGDPGGGAYVLSSNGSQAYRDMLAASFRYCSRLLLKNRIRYSLFETPGEFQNQTG